MFFRTTRHPHRSRSDRMGPVFVAGTCFSPAKNRCHPINCTCFFISFLLFSFLFSPLVHGNGDTRDLKAEMLGLAQQGDAEAQFSLALMYEEGRVVEPDSQKAVYWLSKAAQQNLPIACLYLGMKFEFGNGVQQNINDAEKLYEQAAVEGWAMAQYLLAMLLLDKRSMTNRIDAGAWLKLASEQGYPQAEEKYMEIKRALTEHERTLLSRRYEQYAGWINNRSSGTN